MAVYSRSKIVEYIVLELESGISADKLAPAIASYLLEIGKLNELESILRDARELRAQKYGVVELSARSAHSLQESHLNEIKRIAAKQYPQTKQVITHQVHDENVIGGASLSFPHASLDITVRAKLNQLRESVA